MLRLFDCPRILCLLIGKECASDSKQRTGRNIRTSPRSRCLQPIMTEKFRLAYMVSHPIQYQAPLLKRLAQEPDIDLTVFFWSDHSAREYTDKGFGGVRVKWDVPLGEGYKNEVFPEDPLFLRAPRSAPQSIVGSIARLGGESLTPCGCMGIGASTSDCDGCG